MVSVPAPRLFQYMERSTMTGRAPSMDLTIIAALPDILSAML